MVSFRLLVPCSKTGFRVPSLGWARFNRAANKTNNQMKYVKVGQHWLCMTCVTKGECTALDVLIPNNITVIPIIFKYNYTLNNLLTYSLLDK